MLSGDASSIRVTQALSQLLILLSNYKSKDVYGMGETGLYFKYFKA